MSMLRILLALLVSSYMMSCSLDTNEPGTDNFSVSFGIERTLPKHNLEGIELTDVKILVRSLKLITGQDDSGNVKTDPFVVALDLNGNINTVAVADLPDASYEKVMFEIHKLDSLTTPPDPMFVDAAGRYSAIVRGVYEGIEFIYKSKKSAKQIIRFDNPVTLEEDGVVNVTLIVNPYDWFDDNGQVINPTEKQNENKIDNLIKNSIKRGFRDNNADGLPD